MQPNPHILIVVRNGLIESIFSDTEKPIRYMVIDYDAVELGDSRILTYKSDSYEGTFDSKIRKEVDDFLGEF